MPAAHGAQPAAVPEVPSGAVGAEGFAKVPPGLRGWQGVVLLVLVPVPVPVLVPVRRSTRTSTRTLSSRRLWAGSIAFHHSNSLQEARQEL